MTASSAVAVGPSSGGVLHGVGVGPGDPELMTLKSVRLIQEADVVFCPAGRTGAGRAFRTASAHLEGKQVVELDFEMSQDPRLAVRASAERVAAELDPARVGVFLTEGDPSIYSTFGLLRDRLGEIAPWIRCVAVPGVSSLTAAAAAAGVSLVQGSETLAVVPGSAAPELLKDALAVSDRVAITKPSMQPDLAELMAEAGVLSGSTLVTEAGSSREKVVSGAAQIPSAAPYFSLWLAPGAAPAGGRVYFVGAGPGDPSFLTRRALAVIRRADLLVTADSLVMDQVAGLAGRGARVIGSSSMTLEEVVDEMVTAASQGLVVVRLHSGDPSVYGALAEQIDLLKASQVRFEIVPGVSSVFAAAAALGVELTVPGGAQTVILTRHGRRVPTPSRERLRELASTRATVAIFLSALAVRDVQRELLAGGLSRDTPAAVAYRVSWPDQMVERTTLAGLVEVVSRHRLRRHALLLVGDALGPTDRRSRLYDPGHAHVRRRRRPPRLQPELARLAAVAITRPGLGLAHRLQRSSRELEVYAPAAVAEPGDRAVSEIAAMARRLFAERRPLVMFMAVGAAVRILAPVLSGKSTDPAVVVVDDAGEFAVSLLGGRAAGANRLAEWTAAVLGGHALVTTAAERLGLPALDQLLARRGWQVARGSLGRLEGAVVNHEEILFYGPGLRLPRARPGGVSTGGIRWRRVRRIGSPAVKDRAECAGLAVSDRELGDLPTGWVIARPRALVVGVGCVRAATAREVQEAVITALSRLGLSAEGVGTVATIAARGSHPGIRSLADAIGASLVTFPPESLASVAVATGSGVVMRAVGTPSVAEAAAKLASRGNILQPKMVMGRVTVAIAERLPGEAAEC